MIRYRRLSIYLYLREYIHMHPVPCWKAKMNQIIESDMKINHCGTNRKVFRWHEFWCKTIDVYVYGQCLNVNSYLSDLKPFALW